MVQKEWETQFPFLAQMPEEERRHFLQSAVMQNLHAGEVVVREHANCTGAMFILSGELKAYKVSESGRELALYSAVPGELVLLSPGCVSPRATPLADISLAAQQACTIAVVPGSTFCYLVGASPQLQQFVFSCVYRQYTNVIRLIEKLTFKSVNDRLYEYICENTSDGRMPLYITHAQLAARLGTSREVVTRGLRDLRRAGVLQTERGKIALLHRKVD